MRLLSFVRLLWMAVMYRASSVLAFGTTTSVSLRRLSSPFNHRTHYNLMPSSSSFPLRTLLLHTAKRRNNEEEEEHQDTDGGMARAFQELDALQSLDDDDTKQSDDNDNRRRRQVMEELLHNESLDTPPPPPPEAEVRLYSDMVSELEGKGESSLYSDMLSDMGGDTSRTPTAAAIDDDADDDDDDDELDIDTPISRSPEDMDAFMNKALEEAVEEARKKTPEELAATTETILDDKEMMKEIEQVFEKANQELLDSLEDIRTEQAELAKKSAEESAQKRMVVSAENTERLERAEASMSKMLQKVNEETQEVERAVEDLKAAQAEISDDPLVKLKEGGIVKQSALVGALLFSVRSIAETIAMVGPGGDSHVIPALVQGALALALAALFVLI